MNRFSCRLLVLTIPLLGCAPLAWPGISSCTSGTTLDNYQPPSLDSGCAYVDNSFSNIAVNSQPNSLMGSASTITLTSNPTVGDTLTSTSGLGVAEFTSAAWTQTNSPAGSGHQSDIEYVAQANTGGTLGGYTYTNGVNGYVTPALDPWAISSITLDASNVTTTGPAVTTIVEVSEIFCLSSTTGVSGCSTANSGQILTLLESNGTGGVDFITFECTAPGGTTGCNQSAFTVNTNGSVITYTLPGTAGVQAVSVSETVDLFAQTGTSITLNGLVNDFGEESTVPEPSTFLLVGLAGLGLLRYRRNRH